MDVINNLKQAISLLNEIDDYCAALHGENGLMSTCDKKIDYWEHYLELNPLKVTEVYNISREIKKQRTLRRKYKNDAELIRLYNEHVGKLQSGDNREMLLTYVNRTKNKQDTSEYSYNAYTDDERDEILGIKKKKGVLDTIDILFQRDKEVISNDES